MIEVKVPAVGESITEATIGEWSHADGDVVDRDDVILILETDKASVEVVAEQAGKLSILVEEGETVAIDSVVAKIDTSVAPEKSAPAQAPAASASAAPAAPAPNGGGGTHPDLQATLSPAVQRVVGEKNIDVTGIPGTGRGGRLTKGDVMNAPTAQQTASTPAPAQAPAAPGLPQTTPNGTERRVKMTTIRKRIAERLVQSQQTAAILTTFNEIDMSAVMALRARYKENFKEKYGVSLGFMGFFTKACIAALQEIEGVNAFIEGNEIIYHDYCNIGVAVSSPKGLVVPVIKNSEQLSIAGIEQAIRHYALKARDGKNHRG